MPRLVFMGTPEFAVPVLVALHERYTVTGVVTQPDRPAGRGGRLLPPPVKEAALTRGLPVLQPEKLRDPQAVAQVAAWKPDVIVVAAFGQILRPAILDLPPHGCLNIHASLLPRYRGAAPIPAAILAGDAVSGVTLMLMDEGLDTGPILAQTEMPLAPDETTATLTAKLARLGADLAVEMLPHWLAGELTPRPQDDAQATFCRPLVKEDGLLDWDRPAVVLDRQVRACNPWPGAFTFLNGERIKVRRARPYPGPSILGVPGQVVVLKGGVGVITGQGVLELLEVQLAGKKPMLAELFVRGRRDFLGSVLGG